MFVYSTTGPPHQDSNHEPVHNCTAIQLWLQRQPRGINDSSLEFTAAGRHHGDLTAVIQALLSLHMLIPRQPNRPTDTNRYVTTGATVRKQESFVYFS
jgi:hypothetical protein